MILTVIINFWFRFLFSVWLWLFRYTEECQSKHRLSKEEDINDNSAIYEQLSVRAAGRVLQAQSKTRCYYRRKNSTTHSSLSSRQMSLWHGSRHIVLHAILWPTVVFVLGFVGLFFSCLTLQKEKYSKKKPPKACVV